MRSKYYIMINVIMLTAGLLSTGRAMAGSLDPTNAPGPTMHTLEEIYQAVEGVHQSITNPAGLILIPESAYVQKGYYSATNLTEVDTDLASENIKAGITIFGVTGKTEVVETTSGDATAGDITYGKKAWVDGVEITGSDFSSVPKTGITASITAGDDGDLQKGRTWPNPRFTIGTSSSSNCVTDELTNLMWLKNPGTSDSTWPNAVEYCNNLDGNDGRGGHTDWRLPNVRELFSLIDWRYADPALPNTAGTGQWSSGNPFMNMGSGYTYWSSTPGTISWDRWAVGFSSGWVFVYNKDVETYKVWPVRDAQ